MPTDLNGRHRAGNRVRGNEPAKKSIRESEAVPASGANEELQATIQVIEITFCFHGHFCLIHIFWFVYRLICFFSGFHLIFVVNVDNTRRRKLRKILGKFPDKIFVRGSTASFFHSHKELLKVGIYENVFTRWQWNNEIRVV